VAGHWCGRGMALGIWLAWLHWAMACDLCCGSPFGSLVDSQFGALCGMSCDLASDAVLCMAVVIDMSEWLRRQT
jgi:hypothetical protein